LKSTPLTSSFRGLTSLLLRSPKILLGFSGTPFFEVASIQHHHKEKAETQKGFGFFLVRMMGLDKLLLRKILMLCSALGSF
jgi:hypothetical protein